jgi:hypothetical protein
MGPAQANAEMSTAAPAPRGCGKADERIHWVVIFSPVILPSSRYRVALLVLLAMLAADFVAGGLPVPSALAAERRRVDPRTGMLEVPIDELVVAVRHKDRAEIGRIAERIGPARLGEALRRPDIASVTAALNGIAMLPGAVRLVAGVTELVVTEDAPIATAAVRTLGEILAPITTAELDEWEVPPDVVTATCVVLRTTATTSANPTPLRLAAMDALADASGTCSPTPDLIALLRDPSPAIRRAAALVLRPQQRLATGGFASGTRDIDKGVASASIAALCEILALPGAGARGGGAREPIWDQTRQAARRLAVASETPAEDAVQMLDCLEPTSAADRQILEGLRARPHNPLSDRAAEILGQTRGRARP